MEGKKSTEGVDLETLRMRIDLSLTLAQEAGINLIGQIKRSASRRALHHVQRVATRAILKPEVVSRILEGLRHGLIGGWPMPKWAVNVVLPI